MADIVYEIGAKDKATPALNTVDKGMSRLEASTKSLGEAAERSLGKVSISIGSLIKGAGVMAAVDLAVKGLTSAFGSVVGSISSANAAYDTQVEAVQGLETALRLNGEAVESESARLQTFASEMQAFSGVGDEVTLGLMKQAAMFGVSADQLDDTAAAAIGLSEATGKSLDESLKLVKNSLEGEFGAFGEIIPAIKTATTDTEKLAMVQELAAKGLDAKVEASNRLVGAEERAAGAVGDMMEQVGALLAPLRMVAAQGIQFLAEQMNSLLTPAIAVVQSAFESMQPVFAAVKDAASVAFQVIGTVFQSVAAIASDFIGNFINVGETFGNISDFIRETAISLGNAIIGAVTRMEVIYNNFSEVVAMVFDKVMLAYETYRANTEHLFVTVLPAYVGWFIDNFYNMLETGFNAALTLVMNLGKSFGDAFAAIWDFISSGGQTDILGNLGEIAGRNLMDGFESSVEALPQIAARAMTATEKELTASISQTADKLASEYDAKMAQRTIKIGGKIGEDMATAIDLQLKKTADEVESKTDSIEKSKTATGASTPSDAILQASQSRLLTRGPGERKKDPVDVLEQVLAQQEIATEQAAIAASELAQIKNNLAANPLLTLAPTAP